MILQVDTNADCDVLVLCFVRCKGKARANEKLGSGEARDEEAFITGSACNSQEAHSVALVLPGSDA